MSVNRYFLLNSRNAHLSKYVNYI